MTLICKHHILVGMKVLVTGGTDGIGKQIVDYFAPHSRGISRRNGFDISSPQDREKIARLSLEYDVFVNHAYSRDPGQVLLLQQVAECWISLKKTGHIFNTGTFGTFCSRGIDANYLSQKRLLDETSHQYSQRIEAGEVPFRMTLMRPGMLDTQRSRQKPHWRGNGIRGQTICEILKFVYSLPQDVQIADLVVESILPR